MGTTPVAVRELPGLEVVCAVIVTADGQRVLAGRRLEGKSHGGLWEFPGGKVESGETRRQALGREIREELGLDVEVGQSLGMYAHAAERFWIELHAYICRFEAGDPDRLESCDHSEIRWITPAEGRDLDWAPSDREIFAHIPWPFDATGSMTP